MIRWLLNRLPHDAITVPDEHGGERAYMRRYYLLKTDRFQIRIHEILLSDPGRDLHDHPFAFVTVGLRGSYQEEMPGRVDEYRAPWAHRRDRYARHRLRLDSPVWTLVFTGRMYRDDEGRADWGFYPDSGYVPWWEYESLLDIEKKGRLALAQGEAE